MHAVEDLTFSRLRKSFRQ